MVRIRVFLGIVFVLAGSQVHALEKRPLWVDNLPQSQHAVYFAGVSDYFLGSDASAGEKSRKEGCRRAFVQFAAYLGTRIKSMEVFKHTLMGDSVSSSVTIDSSGASDHLIFGVKPYKIFKEYNEGNTNLRTWCLVKVGKEEERRIRDRIKLDKKEYDNAIDEILVAMDQKNYEHAKNLVSDAKGRRVVIFDNRIVNIEQRLSEILKNILSIDLQLNKKEFRSGEKITISLSVGKKSFVYVFYDNGRDYELVFPNKVMSANILNRADVLEIPNDPMREEEIFITAYADLVGKKGSFLSVTSEDNLFIEKYSVDGSRDFIVFKDNGKWLHKIERCSVQKKCVYKRTNFTLLPEKAELYPLTLDVSSEDPVMENLAENLTKNTLAGSTFHVERNEAKYSLNITISKEKTRSSLIGADMTIIHLMGRLTNIETGNTLVDFSGNRSLVSDTALKESLRDLVIMMVKEMNKKVR